MDPLLYPLSLEGNVYRWEDQNSNELKYPMSKQSMNDLRIDNELLKSSYCKKATTIARKKEEINSD
jgi:hypothetical protein